MANWLKMYEDNVEELLNLDVVSSIFKEFDEKEVSYNIIYDYSMSSEVGYRVERFTTAEERDKRFDEIKKILIENSPESSVSTAHWQTIEGQYGSLFYRCSNCEIESDYIYKHCPQCGAKMKW